MFTRGPFAGTLGDGLAEAALAPVMSAMQATVDPALAALQSRTELLAQRTEVIIKSIQRQERHRKLAVYIGIASAVFAAVKLGIVSFPSLRKRFGDS